MKIADIPTPLADSVRQNYLDFFKARAHVEIPNVSLVPNVDSTLLYTNSGMFPLVNYLAGAAHPLGNRLVNFQRCIRTGEDDIAEIGDWKHTTMFEMMGNWSLGDYFKADEISWLLELYVEVFGLDPKRLFVTVFAGDTDAHRDIDSIKFWQKAFAKHGIEAKVAEVLFIEEDGKDLAYTANSDSSLGPKLENWSMDSDPSIKIFLYPKKKNWWQRGATVGELGGPDTEIFYDTTSAHDVSKFGVAHPNSDSPRFLEIGNSVFIQYKLDENLQWSELSQKNVDFGGGFVRILLARQQVSDLFETEIFTPIIKRLEEISGKNYKDGAADNEFTKYFRIIADHAFGSTFIIADGIKPDRKDQGYILRRLIRRAIRMGKRLGIEQNFLGEIAKIVIGIYQRHYSHLATETETIIAELSQEEDKFRRTLAQGLKELQKILGKSDLETISGEELFYIYETYGFPFELSIEELGLDIEQHAELLAKFQTAETSHRERSRAGAAQKFTGGLADHSEATTRLHTAHHLLLRALQEVLGTDVHQKGSNITADRLRIDFSFPEKLSNEQLSRVTEIVNDKIQATLNVVKVNLSLEAAQSLGAEMEFGQKYGELVSVYLIGNLPADFSPQDPTKIMEEVSNYEIFSKEFCGGPHVKNTAELAESGRFVILKQESSGSGVRRIKASLI